MVSTPYSHSHWPCCWTENSRIHQCGHQQHVEDQVQVHPRPWKHTTNSQCSFSAQVWLWHYLQQSERQPLCLQISSEDKCSYSCIYWLEDEVGDDLIPHCLVASSCNSPSPLKPLLLLPLLPPQPCPSCSFLSHMISFYSLIMWDCALICEALGCTQ